MSIIFYLRKMLPPSKRQKLKRIVRRIKMLFSSNVSKLTKEELYRLITEDFGVKNGDRIFVSSSFGNLCAVDFTPMDFIQMLMRIVGDNGTIMMPYYPPLNSSAWAESGQTFDMEQTKSSMGIVTNLFAQIPGVIKSKHPTKAICVWGKDAALYAADHDKEQRTPYYCNSPYGRFLQAGSKSLAIGIGRMPMVHCVEDIVASDCTALYVEQLYKLPVKENGSVEMVTTRIHDDVLMSKCLISVRFLEKYQCPTFKKVRAGVDYCYCVDNTAMKECCAKLYAQGINRLNC